MKKNLHAIRKIVALFIIVVATISFSYAQSFTNDAKIINDQYSTYINSGNVIDKTLISNETNIVSLPMQNNSLVKQQKIVVYDDGQLPLDDHFSSLIDDEKSLAQTCTYFTAANSTTISGWTEQVGDWAIYNNQLQSPSVAVWNYITYDGSTQADGYVSCRAINNGSSLEFVGVVGRYTSTSSYIMAKIQGSASWTDIYLYCNGSSVYHATGAYGTDAKIKMEYSGANVILMIDTNLDGIWEFIYTATVTNTAAGLCGAGSYNQCYIDNWCYGLGFGCTPPAAPTSVTADPVWICPGSSSNLNATAVVDTVNWYFVPSGGLPIASTPSGVDYIVSPAVTTTYYAEAQSGPDVGIALATGTVAQGSLTLPCTTGTNAGGVVWNPQYSLYYGYRVGTSSYPLYTYNASGTLLSTATTGIDVRGSWWNYNTNKFEMNGYSTGGYRTIDLDANGYALSTGTISPAGQNQPNTQSMGGYDPINNETVFYDAGSIYRYNRSTGALVASGAITGLPAGSINLYWASYSGVPGAEIMIYDYANRAVRFINRLTYAYSASVQLDASAPYYNSYNIGYDGNGKLWLYNGTTAWVNYQIINVGSGCVSITRTPVTVHINTVPVAPNPVTATPSTICIGSSTNLNATAAVTTIDWFTLSSGGLSIGTSTSGSNFLVSPVANITYYAEAIGNTPSDFTTTYAGGNAFNGNMFDVNVLEDIIIKSFDVNSPVETDNYEVYYKTGTWVGFEANAGAWTLIGSASAITGNGSGIPTPLNLNLNLILSAGQTYAFYVTNTAGTMNYTNGTAVGNIYASNAQLELKEGWGGGYPFGSPNTPRIWNGTIHYEVIGTGCASAARTPVSVTVIDSITPTFTISVSFCVGDTPGTLPAISSNGITGTWSPATINTSAAGTTTYTFTPNAGQCAKKATVSVIVYPIPPTPVITLTGNILSSSAATGNQWYFNNTLLSGENGQTYTVTTNGTYYDIVTVNGCISDTSNIIQTAVGIEENPGENSIMIYPNPVTNEMSIVYKTGIELIEVYDVTGKLIIHTNYNKLGKVEVNVSELANGIYAIRINSLHIRTVMK